MNSSYLKTSWLLAGLSCLAFGSLANAQTIVNPNANSGYINAEWDLANPTYTAGAVSNMAFIGAMSATAPGSSRQSFIGFDLPTLASGETLDTAVFEFSMRSSDAKSSNPWFNIDAYGFTTAPTVSDAFIGSLDGTKTLLQDDLLSAATTNGELISLDISSYLSSFYSGGNTPSVSAVYIRLNPDDDDGSLDPATGEGDGFGRYRALVHNSTLTVSSISAIPEPSTYAAIAGALALGMVAYRRRK